MSTKLVITRAVWLLSFVSLFTDVASELLYPVMPIYLKSIGFSVLLIGILEGVAEAVAGISKGYFGSLSDRKGERLLFVRLGYGLSAFSKPLLILSRLPAWVFATRTADRVGKGIRTGARDALLADECTPETRGRVFGLHRAMDTTGAVIGPVIALVYLYFAPGHYAPLFYFSFIPGVLAVSCLFLLKAKPLTPNPDKVGYHFFAFVQYWRRADVTYRKLAGTLIVFALFNSSDYFLLLRLRETGCGDVATIGMYVFYNVIYALASYPLGGLGDKIGYRKVLAGGLLVFALVYGGLAYCDNWSERIGLFLLYGIYAAATDGISKAWITTICNKQEKATAIGTFAAFQSIAAMLASVIAGIIGSIWGLPVVFILSAIVATATGGYLLLFCK